MKFFIGPSRVRIPPRTQTQQKRGASVNFVIIFLVVSRSFKTVTTACCIRKKVTICAAYSLRWGKKLKNWKRENVKNALTGTHVFFRLCGMCCYSVIDKIVIFAMSWAWKKKKSEFPTELLWVRSYTRFMCNMRLAQWQELLKAVNKWENIFFFVTRMDLSSEYPINTASFLVVLGYFGCYVTCQACRDTALGTRLQLTFFCCFVSDE